MSRVIDGFCRLLDALIALALALMVVLVFGNVVLRYGFNSGITVSEELSRWLFVWMTLLGAMALGIPIAYALLVTGVALMVHLNQFDAQILAQNVISGADSFPLLAVPFFILAGEIMNVGGLSRRIVDLALALVGHIRGGLGYVTIVAACLLAALSGSAVADAAALATLLLPMMERAGHDRARSAGLIASAGIIAPVVPPSI